MPLQANRPSRRFARQTAAPILRAMAERQAADRAGSDQGPSGSREAGDGAERRHETRSGSGSNEPKHNERKEQRGDWESRQGGDQTRGSDGRPTGEPAGDGIAAGGSDLMDDEAAGGGPSGEEDGGGGPAFEDEGR